MPEQTRYPRITLKCECGNEFNANVMRMKDKEPVMCLICGTQFPVNIGEMLAKAFEDLYKAKYQLDKEGSNFKYAFVYKSTFSQPPAPYALGEDSQDDNASKD